MRTSTPPTVITSGGPLHADDAEARLEPNGEGAASRGREGSRKISSDRDNAVPHAPERPLQPPQLGRGAARARSAYSPTARRFRGRARPSHGRIDQRDRARPRHLPSRARETVPGAMEGAAPARVLDLLRWIFERFEAKDVLQKEAERTGDVVLQRGGTEHPVCPDLVR